MRILEELRGHALQERMFHRQHRLARRQSGAIGDAEDMRIHRHRRLAEGGIHHHVRGLAADAGQGFERCAVARHFAVVLFEQLPAHGDHVRGFGIEQSDGGDVRLQTFDVQRGDRLRRIRDRKQPAHRLVDADIGGLRRQDHR